MTKNNYCLQIDGDLRLYFFDTLDEAYNKLVDIEKDAVVFDRSGKTVVERVDGILAVGFEDQHQLRSQP